MFISTRENVVPYFFRLGVAVRPSVRKLRDTLPAKICKGVLRMSAISSVSALAAPPASSSPPPASRKVDSDGDHDNSPPSEAASKSASRAVNVLA